MVWYVGAQYTAGNLGYDPDTLTSLGLVQWVSSLMLRSEDTLSHSTRLHDAHAVQLETITHIA